MIFNIVAPLGNNLGNWRSLLRERRRNYYTSSTNSASMFLLHGLKNCVKVSTNEYACNVGMRYSCTLYILKVEIFFS